MNDIKFRTISKQYQRYLNNYFILNSFHSQVYDEDQMNSIMLGDFRINYLTRENFIYLRNRAFLLFLYTEIESYFFNCLKAVYIEHPLKLKGKNIKIDWVFEYNKKLIIEAKAEKIVEELIRNKWKKIFDKIKEGPYNIHHQIKNDDIKKLEEFQQIRNIYAHGNGNVNQILLENSSHSVYKLGDRIELTPEFFRIYEDPIISLMTEFDIALIKEYPSFAFKSKE